MFISGAFVCTCAFLLLCKRCCSRFNSFKMQLMLEISESVLIKTIILLYKNTLISCLSLCPNQLQYVQNIEYTVNEHDLIICVLLEHGQSSFNHNSNGKYQTGHNNDVLLKY